MDGVTVTVNGQTQALSGWWMPLSIPYTAQDEILIGLAASSERVIAVQWWAE